MAQKKRRKHGKVEARKAKPMIRFKLGVLLLLIAASFAGCFALYLVSATSQPDYWEKEIVGSTEAVESDAEAVDTESTAQSVPSAAVNPVPSSERAEEARLSVCAYAGEFSEFTAHYQTASGMVFTDAVFDMPESEMRTIADKVAAASPLAMYIWYSCPEDAEKGLEAVEKLLTAVQKKSDVPLYLMTALPAADKEENRRIDDWNTQLLALADRLGVHYVDVSTMLKANDGTRKAEYAQEDALYEAIGEQLLTHVAD